jgi:D-alanyl-D-alanine carboxypeptidase/D-alanyl-D-alanine-endopeptidase (penicillin-binding protein 4)
MAHSMTHRPFSRIIAILAILLIALLDVDAASPKKKKKSTAKKKPVATRKAPPKKKAAAPAPTGPVGATFQERINSLVHGAVARGAETSIQIVELETGRVVAERNPHMALAPASNMKLFTTAVAIDLLKPTFEVTTSVFVRGEVDQTGTLHGDVKFVGKGDPTIGGRFHDGDATAVIREWTSDLKRAGIKNINGNLVFEYGYMDTEYIHPTWPVDQLVAWYEAPIAAFALQEGCIAVRVLPSRAGKPCVVQLDPPTSYVTIQNTCRTGGGLPYITRHRGSNNVIVRGGVPARSRAGHYSRPR